MWHEEADLDLTTNSRCFHYVSRRPGQEDDNDIAQKSPVVQEKENFEPELGGAFSFSETVELTYSLWTFSSHIHLDDVPFARQGN